MTKKDIRAKANLVFPPLSIEATATTNVSSTSIDVTSGRTITTTTTLPPEVLQQPTEKRDALAAEIIGKEHKLPQDQGVNLSEIINTLLEGKTDERIIESGNNLILINCSIYGHVGGTISDSEITFINNWNQIKDNLDVKQLRNELNEIKKHIVSKEESHIVTPSEKAYVIKALDELDKANGAGTLKYLKKAGKIVVEMAKDIGAQLIIEVLKGKI